MKTIEKTNRCQTVIDHLCRVTREDMQDCKYADVSEDGFCEYGFEGYCMNEEACVESNNELIKKMAEYGWGMVGGTKFDARKGKQYINSVVGGSSAL